MKYDPKRRLQLLVLVTFVCAGILLIFRDRAFAASAACARINAYGTATANDWTFDFSPDQLQPGDHISINVGSASGFSATGATLQVGGSDVATSGVPGTLSYTVTSAGATSIRVYISPWPEQAVIDWGCGDAPSGGGSSSGNSDVVEKSIPQCANLFDGRINNQPDMDCAAPVAIYGGSITVYAINPDTGQGTFAFRATDEQIEAVGIPSTNTMLGQATNPVSGQLIMLYRLTTGEFQVNAWYPDGKPYVFVWDEDGNKYHLAG